MLYNDNFLYKLYNSNIQTKYAKIITLNWQEEPIMEIQGLVTGGSCNVDGNSAVRTTISLNMITKTADLKDYTIMLKTKVKIDIGLENNIDPNFPKIIWFPLGIFIVTGYNTSINTTNTTISLNGKDKGCLLNGEIGGVIGASTDFGQVNDYKENYESIIKPKDNGKGYYVNVRDPDNVDDIDTYILDTVGKKDEVHYERTLNVLTSKLPIREIIRNIVHIYGNEPNNKIFINDLDLSGRELLEYRGTKPMYLIKQYTNDGDTSSNMYADLTFDSNYQFDSCYKKTNNKQLKITKISELKDNQFLNLNSVEDELDRSNEVYFKKGNNFYQVVRIEYGDTIGYKGTELIFPGELIANVGETVVSVLDKIKNILGNFEYFYDPYGNFIFQAKHTYENVNFSKIKTNEDNELIIDGSFYNNSYIYTFSDENSMTQISHNPNITNLKNDFSIWGERQSVNNTKVPIHLRYAIQNRPKEYINYEGIHFKANDGTHKMSLFKEAADEYDILLQDKENRLKELEDKKSHVEALLKRYEEIIFLQEESAEDIQKNLADAIYEINSSLDLSKEDQEKRIQEITDYYNRRLKDSIWMKTQLEKAEELSFENSIYNNYDDALRQIGYKKIPDLDQIDKGTLVENIDIIMNSNIYKLIQKLKLNPNDEIRQKAESIKR